MAQGQFTITIRGGREIIATMDKDDLWRIVTRGVDRGIYRSHRRIATYPPPSQSAYPRTGTLGRSWTTNFRSLPGRYIGTIGTIVEYAPWVQSASQQTRGHRSTGWKTVEDVVKEESEILPGEIEKEIQERFNRA